MIIEGCTKLPHFRKAALDLNFSASSTVHGTHVPFHQGDSNVGSIYDSLARTAEVPTNAKGAGAATRWVRSGASQARAEGNARKSLRRGSPCSGIVFGSRACLADEGPCGR